MALSMFDTSMFDPFADFGGLGGGAGGYGRAGGNVSALRLDLYETENEFKMTMDCPGVDSENLNIECEGNVLRVSCETKRDEEEARNAKWHRWERAGNITATRSLRFPDSADMSKVEAKLDNGVLCICIGKRAESRARKLAIKSRQGAQRIGVEAEPAEQRREVIRDAPRREAAEPRREAERREVLLPVGVAEAAQPRAYEPSREHERVSGFAEREAAGPAAPKVGEKLGVASHGMREGLEEQRPSGAAGTAGTAIGYRGREEERYERPRGAIEERGTERGFEGRTHAAEGVAVSPPQAVTEGRAPQAMPATGEAAMPRREEAYESRGAGAGAGAGTYGERERIGAEHIGVRATRADEFSGREAYGREGEGREGGREGVARVMYSTRAEQAGREAGAAYGREGEAAAEGEERHRGGIMGKVSDTMHHLGAKLSGKD